MKNSKHSWILVYSRIGVVLAVILMISIALFGFVNANSQVPGLQWSKTYGPYGGYSVVEDADGGYLIAGENATYGTHGYNNYLPMLIKINSSGDLEWGKTFGSEFGVSNAARSLIVTRDSGYALSGDGGWFLKVDAQGNVQWNRTYGEELLRCFVVEASDGYVLAGWIPNGENGYGSFMVKIDSVGNVVWNQTFIEEGSSHIFAYSLIKTNDGGFAVGGQWLDGNFWFAKIDSAGNLMVNKTYDLSTTSGVFESIAGATDGGYILAGWDGLGASLVKVDDTGDIQWNRQYENSSFQSITPTIDGGYIAAGVTSSSYGLVKMDANGNILWTTKTDGQPFSVISTKDDGFIVSGSIVNNTVWAAKFAPESTNIPDNTSPPPDETTQFLTYIVIGILLVAVAGIGLWVYLKKHKH